MEKFDAEKYKSDNNWDSHYSAYMTALQQNAVGMGSDYYNFYQANVEQPINLYAKNYVEFSDNRANNKIPTIVTSSEGASFKNLIPVDDQKKFNEVVEQANGCVREDLANNEDVIAVLNIIEVINNGGETFKDDEGNEAEVTKEEKLTPITSADKLNEALLKVLEASNAKTEETQKADATEQSLARMQYNAWDPRLSRSDEFLMGTEGVSSVRVPFASYTAATAFSDLNWVVEKKLAEELVNRGGHKGYNIAQYFAKETTATQDQSIAEASQREMMKKRQQAINRLSDQHKVLVNDPTESLNDQTSWGVASIVNPYSLTKLMGGVSPVQGGQVENYMYDIRDRRRFYGQQSVNGDDVLAVSNPTVTQIIQWSNSDIWGRTPYSFQDFVFCKHFGLIPNNRLITLRRYPAPTYDNLQFEQMFGDIENKSTGKINELSKQPEDGKVKTFAPRATVVSYFGEGTGNTVNQFMKFSTGMNWTDIQAKIHEVSGDEGDDIQGKIDGMFTGESGYSNAEHQGIDQLLRDGSFITGKILSFGKFALGLNGTVGMEDDVFQKLAGANVDPYGSGGLYENRVVGPLNRIDSVKKRAAGISFEQSLTVKCEYKAKAIGGINPKAAILDVLGNCLEMASPSAVFWGGGHRFMITPHLYPYHDGGWRDSFMKQIYDGNFLGKNGAIAFALSGLKKTGQKNGTGEFSWDNLKSNLSGILGEGAALLGAAISSVASMFGDGNNFIGDIGDSLMNNNAGELSEEEKADRANKAKGKINNMFSNLQTMWHSKMLQETSLPKITGMAALLIGEPVGEWHLTVGNPLNPVVVIGNLICSKMQVDWNEELGPDDFPTELSITYTLEHGMARDKDAIQSMFNRGMGKYYCLPDWIKMSSDMITGVDKFSKAAPNSGDLGSVSYLNPQEIKNASDWGTQGYKQLKISEGNAPTNHGSADTRLITKFTPIDSNATRNITDILTGQGSITMPRIRSLAATRKIMG